MEWQQVQQISQTDGEPLRVQLEAHLSGISSSVDYDFGAWGWAVLPPLQEMLHHSQHCDSSSPISSHARQQDVLPFHEALQGSRAYQSPHCAPALTESCGFSSVFDGMAGSCVLPVMDEPTAEAMRTLLKGRINGAWSTEAVRQGVGYAKAGNYDEALRCYDKAIELQHDNADAYVARGAAYANSRQYSEAAHSFRHAIQIDPLSRNATQYLDAVIQRAAHEGVTISQVQTPAVEGHKQQGQGDGGPKAQKTRHIPQSPTPAVAGRLEDPGKEHMEGPDRARTTGKRKAGTIAGASSSSSSDTSGSSDSTSSGDSCLEGLDPHDIKRALAAVLKARSAKKGSRKSSKKRRKKSKESKENKEKKHSKSKKRKHKSKRRHSY